MAVLLCKLRLRLGNEKKIRAFLFISLALH